MRNYAYVQIYISYALKACFGIFTILLFYSLVKQYGYKIWLFVLGIIMVALQIVCFALRMDNSMATYASIVISDVVLMLLLSGAMITLKRHRKEQSEM